MNFRNLSLAVFLVIATAGSWLCAADPQSQPATSPGDTDRTVRKLVPAPNDLLENVQNELHKMQSLEADFEEVVFPKDPKNAQTFKGHLAAKEPNLVSWDVQSPHRNKIVVLGENMRMWDVDKPGNVLKRNLAGTPIYKAMAQQTRDWAGGNFKVLAESYDVFIEPQDSQDKPLVLRFIPKPRTGLTNTFTSVSLTLAKDLGVIQRIVYRKSTGEVYVITLYSPQINKPIPQTVWEIPPR